MRAPGAISFAVLLALTGAAAGQTEHPRFAQSAQYPLFPQALEIELALSAAPKHLRDGASVWVLAQSGYTMARKGTNPFTCVVSRRAGSSPRGRGGDGAEDRRVRAALDQGDARVSASGHRSD